jgi:hypothetical protein
MPGGLRPMKKGKDQPPGNGKNRTGILLSLFRTLLPTGVDPGLLLVGVLTLFVIFPLFQPGLPGTADTPIHFYRTLEYAHSWAPGVVYPRWAPHLAYGYGYPLWNFAPPLPYLIPLALRAAGFSLEASLKGLMILTALSYALGAYVFVRDNLGPESGLVAAAIYTLAPFALREALLYGGNYPQYLAIGLYPWVLWRLRRVSLAEEHRTLNIVLAAVCYGAVILSHLFHALILTPVALAYVGVLWLNNRRAIRRLGASVLALGLGLAWTAFFWLPALIERNFTRAVGDIYVSVSPFYVRFLSWGELLAWPQALDVRAANPWVPFSLGPAALLLGGLGLLALVTNKPTDQQANRSMSQQVSESSDQLVHYHGLFFFGLLVLSVFMVLPASIWFWANIPFLVVGEFPWRLLGLANLSLAFLGGASIGWASSPRRGALAGGATLAVLLSSVVYLYPFRPFVRYGATVADMAGYEMATQAIGTTTLGEYLPQWVTSVPNTSPLAEALAKGDLIQKLDRASLPEGATVQLLEHTAVSDGYRFSNVEPFQARFLTYYFPGWMAYLDGQPIDIAVEPGKGFITVPVPTGSHELLLRFGDTPLRVASNAITGLTLVLLAIAGLWAIVRGRKLVTARWLPPSPNGQPLVSIWGWRPALLVVGGLAGLFLVKELVVDPRTSWFRHESPPGRVSGVQFPLDVSLDDRFWLLGYDVDRNSVAQGEALQVILYWQAQGPIATNYRSFVHLDSPTDQRTWAGSNSFHPGDATAQIELPTSTWDTVHYVRDEHVLRVPSRVPPVGFDLRAGLYDPKTGQRLPVIGGAGTVGQSTSPAGDTVRLGAIQVTRGRGIRIADVPNRVSYQLGEGIELLGHDWDPEGTTLTLYWRSDQSVTDDYVVFVHLLDGQERLAWGADGPPLGGLYPTSAWEPGRVVVDPRQLALDELLPGSYLLAVGLYNPDTLVRLPVTDVEDDAIPLTWLTWP